MYFSESRRGRRDQLAINTRLIIEIERIRHLNNHHAIEQCLVLALLQELAKLRQVGMRDDGLIQINQGKARDLDVFFLRERKQQVQKLALDLEYLDHLKHAATRGIHCARPRPGAWVALITVICDFG